MGKLRAAPISVPSPRTTQVAVLVLVAQVLVDIARTAVRISSHGAVGHDQPIFLIIGCVITGLFLGLYVAMWRGRRWAVWVQLALSVFTVASMVSFAMTAKTLHDPRYFNVEILIYGMIHAWLVILLVISLRLGRTHKT